MKKLFITMLIGLGLFMSSTLAQPEPTELTFTLAIGRTVTDSILVPGGYVPASVRTLDITNATTITPCFSFGRTASVFYPVLEVGSADDLAAPVADSSITPFDANSIQSALGEARPKDKVWMQLKVPTAEAAIKYFVVRFRYF